MPNGTEFPKFPTAFTEKEQVRLKELGEQRREIERIYQAKFTPEAWTRVSPIEKAVRWVLPSWVSPAIRAITPWEKGAWDYGFTPEQVQEYRFGLEEEYKELVRQEKVTKLLPAIETDLAIAALSGEPITDISELLSNFPELKADFTEEERTYLSSLAQTLVHASPEDILSGKVFTYEPSQLPITPEDIETLSRDPLFIDPRYLLSTVAFSKNLGEIATTLQQAYPPQVEEVEVDEAMRQKVLDYFRQRAIDLGITPKEGEPTQETIKKIHEQIAKEEGELLVLRNEETGDLVSARKKPDNTVWFEDELLGHYDEKTSSIVPIDIDTGLPLLTEEAQESKLKDLWDSFYLGLHQAWYGTRQGLSLALKEAISPKTITVDGKEVRIGTGGFPGQTQLYQNLSETVDSWLENSESQFQGWLVEHPELLPRPEYTQSPIEHPELLKDPYFYAYTILSNAPIIGAALVVGIATTGRGLFLILFLPK